MTRRNITLAKISNNILLHNDPKDAQNYSDLIINQSSSTQLGGPATRAALGHANSNRSSYSRPPSGFGSVLFGKIGHQLQSNENLILANNYSAASEDINSSKTRIVFKRQYRLQGGEAVNFMPPQTAQVVQRPRNFVTNMSQNQHLARFGTQSNTRVILSTRQTSDRIVTPL